MKKSAIVAFLMLFASAEATPAYSEEVNPAEQTVPSNQPPPSFAELQVHPEPYQGQEIVLGGKVMTALQYHDTTQIEVMQLPLGPGQQPEPNQAFVVDPAQTTSAYPVLEVKILTVWRSTEPVASQVVPPAVAPVPPPAVAPVTPLPETPGVMDPYYTPYWDPAVGAWSWQPFWIFPWWASPAIVVSPSIVIVRRHRVPFGLPHRRIGPPLLSRATMLALLGLLSLSHLFTLRMWFLLPRRTWSRLSLDIRFPSIRGPKSERAGQAGPLTMAEEDIIAKRD